MITSEITRANRSPPLELVLAADAALHRSRAFENSLVSYHCRDVYRSNQFQSRLAQACIDDHVARLLLIDEMLSFLNAFS